MFSCIFLEALSSFFCRIFVHNKKNKIQKIFHFARADLTFIKYYLKVDVENAQCTKLQSRLARTFSDRHGLKDLIKEIITKYFKACGLPAPNVIIDYDYKVWTYGFDDLKK